MRKPLFASLALCAALVAATPAMADRDHHRKHRGYYDRPHQVVYYEPRYVPVRRVVRYREVPVRYYYAPAPVYVVERHHHDNDAAKWIGGAILVGAILHHVDHH